VRGMWEDDLSFFVARARMGNKKLEPFGGEERHVTAENEIPSNFGGSRRCVLQRSDDAAERPFAGPAIFQYVRLRAEVAVLLGVSDNRNFRSAGLRQLNDFQQQWNRAKANQGFVAPKTGAGSSGENIATHV